MTLHEIADELDVIALAMANALMPKKADDVEGFRRAYVLGIATHAIKQRAEDLRRVAPPPTSS